LPLVFTAKPEPLPPPLDELLLELLELLLELLLDELLLELLELLELLLELLLEELLLELLVSVNTAVVELQRLIPLSIDTGPVVASDGTVIFTWVLLMFRTRASWPAPTHAPLMFARPLP